uniref:Uncharacterized protein n=1 Tax=Ananas comosus var. bracteatus TaxID=296719 RepID=A0A6V7NTQ0_ANACO|nr:unnamed protein product [Ananas comosus var. bracteatus]
MRAIGRNTVNDPPESLEKLRTQFKHSNLAICKGPMCYKSYSTKNTSEYATYIRDPPEGCLALRPTLGCLAGAEPNGPVVVNILTLGMSLAHGNPLRRPIPHGEYVSRWLSPECRLVGSDPHKHVRMSTMART